jgi:hypothetical protein
VGCHPEGAAQEADNIEISIRIDCGTCEDHIVELGDIGEKLPVLAGLALSKNSIDKILGPSAEYLGDELKTWTEKRLANLKNIFDITEQKLGNNLDQPGRVHPKVLKDILDDGTFADDALAADYFGGVMASSRLGVDEDDRGAVFTQLIASLSVYQLRSHYHLYSILRSAYKGRDFIITDGSHLLKMRIFIPIGSFWDILGVDEDDETLQIFNHTVVGLIRMGLIDGNTMAGSKEDIVKHWEECTREGVLFVPSAFGVELYHWAHGVGRTDINQFLKEDAHFESTVEMKSLDFFIAPVLPFSERMRLRQSDPR